MTDYKLSADSKLRIETMVKTNNGFIIAETDLSIRGPGDLLGTQQSGALDLLIADLGKDGELLHHARDLARQRFWLCSGAFPENPLWCGYRYCWKCWEY